MFCPDCGRKLLHIKRTGSGSSLELCHACNVIYENNFDSISGANRSLRAWDRNAENYLKEHSSELDWLKFRFEAPSNFEFREFKIGDEVEYCYELKLLRFDGHYKITPSFDYFIQNKMVALLKDSGDKTP